ncbi:MAG: hypothetical protein ABR559_08395 [Gemmatimonadota bacterium]
MKAAPVLAVLLLVACSGAQSSPEGTVRSFLGALEARDSTALAETFTAGTMALVNELAELTRAAEGASEGMGGQPAITIEDWCQAFCGGTVEGSTLHGDSATVDVRVGTDVNALPVVREGDEWKIELGGRLAPAVQMLRLTVDADTLS